MTKSNKWTVVSDLVKIKQTCRDCSKEKSLDKFDVQNKKIIENQIFYTVRARCKLCRSRYQSVRRKEHNYIREYERDWRLTRKLENRAKIDQFKARPCMDCGERFSPVAMDLDHRPGTGKIENISAMLSHNRPWSMIESELLKVDLVCACCHRLRTFQRYEDTRKSYDEISRHQKRTRRQREFVNLIKTTPCALCNRTFLPHQMDWDHVDPATKCMNLNDMVARRFSRKAILDEVAKCQLLCVCCHRIKIERIKHKIMTSSPLSTNEYSID